MALDKERRDRILHEPPVYTSYDADNIVNNIIYIVIDI